jgi:ABC-type nitrate/sulfonate/bicarbonate transport system substrate-binding protein
MKPTASWITAALIVAGCLAAPAVERALGAEKIKITVPAPSTASAPLYHAQAAGYFAEEGIDVEIVVIPGAASVQSVIAREAQFALAPGTYQMMAYEKGHRLLAVMSLLSRNSINLVMHKDVAHRKNVGDQSSLAAKIRALKGLKVTGLTPGGFAHQVLVSYLLKAGLDPQKDVQLVGLGPAPALLAALEQRQVDAFATGTPTPEAAVARGLAVMIVDNAAAEDPDFVEFMMGVILVAPETVTRQPGLVRNVVRALLKSNAWLLDHAAEQAMPIVKPALARLDDAVILAGLKKTRLGIPRDGRITERAVTLTQEFLRNIGALKATIPYEHLVTNEFLAR